MPQLDVSFFSIQLFYLVLVFGILYIVISKLILPKGDIIIANRTNLLQRNMADSKSYNIKVESLRKEKEKKIKELNIQLENLQREALDFLEEQIMDQNVRISNSLSEQSKSFFQEVKRQLNFFYNYKEKTCISLAAFIIEKITNKSADLKALEKFYREI